jgi:uncharacterized protein involved in exopolysaccharide biosynthesis
VNVELLSPQQQQGPGLADYVSVVKRRIWHVILPFLLFGAAGFGVAFVVPKEYLAKTEVVVEDPDSMVGSVFTPVGYSVPHKQLLTTIKQDVNRTEFLAPLVEQYGITEGFNPSIQRERTRMFEKVRKRLGVNWAPAKTGPDFIVFTYEGRDSVRVTEFVNAVRRKWQDDFMKRYGEAVKAVENNIITVFNEAQRQYGEAQTKLRNFQDLNGSDYFGKDPGGQANALLAALTRDLDNYETQLKGEEASLRIVSEQLEKTDAISQTDSTKKRNPDWTTQSQKIETVEAQIRALEQHYTDEWTPLKNMKTLRDLEKSKLETIDPWIVDTVQQGPNIQWITLQTQKRQHEVAIAALRDKIDKTKLKIEPLEKEVKTIPEKASRAQTLRDAVDNAYVAFEKANRTRETAKATKDRVMLKAKSFVRVVLETTPEEAKFAEPVYPNYLLFTGLGAFIGLLLGGGFAFISEFTAASFTTANQCGTPCRCPCSGRSRPS